MKFIKFAVIALALGAFTTASAQDNKVIVGQLSWGYAKVMANVIKILAEENYGIQVDSVPGNHPVFFKAMDQGKGEVDIHPDLWLPNNQGLIDNYVKERGTVALTEVKFPAFDGFCSTKAASDQYGLKSVYDLARPEIVELTDRNGDGKGEIWMGAPGWKSTKIHQIRARDYGFADLYDLTISEESVILAQIDADIKAGRVVVWACYLPHHIFGMHPLVILEEPEHDPSKWNIADLENDPNWLENSTAGTAFPAVTSQIAYSKRLETQIPNMVKLLNGIKWTQEVINDWSFAMAVEERDPAEYSREWVDSNRDMVQSWLSN